MNGRGKNIKHTMNTRIIRRMTPIGRLPVAVVIACMIGAPAWGQAGDGAASGGRGAQERDNLQRQIQQYDGAFAPEGALPPGSSNAPVPVTAGPSFNLEVRGGLFLKPSGEPNGQSATVGHLLDVLQETSTLNVIESSGVADVPLMDFKLREVNATTVLNILPSLTGNTVAARVIASGGARGRRGGTGGMGVASGMSSGAVYRLELILPENPANTADNSSGSSSSSTAVATTAAPARPMASCSSRAGWRPTMKPHFASFTGFISTGFTNSWSSWPAAMSMKRRKRCRKRCSACCATRGPSRRRRPFGAG
jgi:hypothetical protein